MDPDTSVELASYFTHAADQFGALATALRRHVEEHPPMAERSALSDAATATVTLAHLCRAARDALIRSYLAEQRPVLRTVPIPDRAW